ncbi:delta-12 fatty acid desaturas-like protein [Pseudovirgaria hyperparasitica]|uniref:Delta-12 fatty acid desaturas-like protein n=1 Tax=Pseudovirgaria hyperparasitica TaxID=470096 RepID=A0A6A6WK79_9PEZI|nr:delta-12 fatty acid desaturas-like protein [Pseudovirgaria hyperparasitica]KAF2762577.1 delta-12 fatty acid desaturas-like protein [Pseudovirgaria hyperparasitica]
MDEYNEKTDTSNKKGDELKYVCDVNSKDQPSQRCEAVDDLRKAIPAHCFKPLYRYAFYYTVRDLVLATTLCAVAFLYIPQIPNALLRTSAWLLYGYAQGLVLTGLWVLGHECGHSAFSPSDTLNNTIGFLLHSALLTPYFAWRSTHRRHHIYANNLAKDHNYVPPRKAEYLARLSRSLDSLDPLAHLAEDSPLSTLLRIVLQQLVGWPWYLLTNITAAPNSISGPPSQHFLGNSHFLPWSTLFCHSEAYYILASDMGILATTFLLYKLVLATSWQTVALIYLFPWLWLNHWIVAITYLHHTHPQVPKYEDSAWSFLHGATATIDRDFGWIGRLLFHNIIDYHVVHHLFPRIPFYHTATATSAIKPLLGSTYREDRQGVFLKQLYVSFTQCQYVEPVDPYDELHRQVLVYRAGPAPGPVFGMRS